MQRLKYCLREQYGKLVKAVAGIVFGVMSYFYSYAVFAEDDELAGVMTSVQSNFGIGSTFVKLLYLAEVIVGVFTYHKTKNIPVLLGIVIISLFLNYSLSHWVFK